MSERSNFDALVRSWLDAEAQAAPPDDLLGPVITASRSSRPMPTWQALLTVPAMRAPSRVMVGSPGLRTAALILAVLAALALGAGAAALASGLLRQAEQPDFGAGLGCPAQLPAGQVMDMQVSGEGSAGPDSQDPPAGHRLRLYDDGLLPSSGFGPRQAQVRSGEPEFTARRLSPHGIELVVDRIEHDGLGPGCNSQAAPVPERMVTVRSRDGSVRQTEWGNRQFVRRMTPAEFAAANTFTEMMLDLDSWLPADAWIDATERPYVPDRWQLRTTSTDLESLGSGEVPDPLPDAADVALPDGTALATAGVPYRETVPADLDQPAQQGRCAVVSAADADAIRKTFIDAGAVLFNSSWWFTSGDDRLVAHVRPLMPVEDGCSATALGLLDAATAPPTPAWTGPPGDRMLAS